jgi:hypothetical protein
MKKLVFLILILSLFFYCAPKQDGVERIIEDGVEVAVNHLEPYKIDGELSTFTLTEELVIDTERNDVAAKGLTDLSQFDIDSEGSIYCLDDTSNKDFIFKFDKSGKFITSFGTKGQGPGELNQPYHLGLNYREQIVVTDYLARKLLFYDKQGNFIKAIDINFMAISAHPLSNGKYLVWYQITGDGTDEYAIQTPLSLRNSSLEEIKELDRYKLPNYRITGKRRGTDPLFSWAIPKRYIFIANETRNGEIWVFDLEGNLVRKIKKPYNPVSVPEEYKKERLNGIKFQEIKDTTYFPESFPSFQGIFAGDTDRLYVMTFEKDAETNEYSFDLFNPDGFYVGRRTIDVMFRNGIVVAKIIENHLYCASEKDSGYKELTVYRMNWE